MSLPLYSLSPGEMISFAIAITLGFVIVGLVLLQKSTNDDSQ